MEEGGQSPMVGMTLSYSSIGLSLWFYLSPVQTLPCPQIPPATPVPHIETSVCSFSELRDVIMPPSPLLQCENGSHLLLQGLFKELALWRGSTWRSIHQPVWEWGGGVVLFCFFPLGYMSS